MTRKFLIFGTRPLPKYFSPFTAVFFLAFSSFGFALAPGSFVTKGPSGEKKIALTFDDGPGPETGQFLDLLDQYKVKGTFFMLSEQVKYRSSLARKVAERGQEIASHTPSHRNYVKHLKEIEKKFSGDSFGKEKAAEQTRQDLIDDMNASRAVIESATSKKLKILRMPHGIDRPWIKEAARESGFILVNWTYGSDWLTEPEEKLRSAYIKAIQPGGILLFHDGGSKRAKSLALTEAVIKAAQEQGYQIVTVGELLGLK